MTPLLLFQATVDDIAQDLSPSYGDLSGVFTLALSRALATEDPSKTQGIAWAGPIRVTRKVHAGVLPGGVASAASLLVYGDVQPDIVIQPDAYALLVGSIEEGIRTALIASGGSNRVVQVNVTAYSPTQNGPLSFWTSGQDATTHTRDRFPDTNALGEPSVDQNENPVGPSDPNLAPVVAPNVTAGVVSNLTPLLPSSTGLVAVAVIVGVLAAVYFLSPIVGGARAVVKGVTRRSRKNPRGGPSCRDESVHVLPHRRDTARAFARKRSRSSSLSRFFRAELEREEELWHESGGSRRAYEITAATPHASYTAVALLTREGLHRVCEEVKKRIRGLKIDVRSEAWRPEDWRIQ